MKIPIPCVSPALTRCRRSIAASLLFIGASFFLAANVSSQVTFTQGGPTSAPTSPQASSDAAPTVAEVVQVSFELPKNFLPAALPAQPWDDTIRVGLVLPTFDPDMSANWPQAVKSEPYYSQNTNCGEGGCNSNYSTGSPLGFRVTVVNKIILNFDEPAAVVLPKIIGRLFKHTEIVRTPAEISRCDLLLKVSLSSHVRDNPDGTFRGVEVNGFIIAETAAGVELGTIGASGEAYTTKGIYWSERTRAKAVGVPALQAMLNQLVINLTRNESLNKHVGSIAAERARPSELQTTASFDDGAAFFPNGRLDAGESARLLFKIHNAGAGPAFAIHLKTKSGATDVALLSDTEVGDLPPGGEREISVPIAAGAGVETSVVQLPFEILEKRGYGGRPIVLEVATEKLRKPTLEIVDVSLGNGGGRPANGDLLDATVRVRNSGPGAAAGVVLTVTSTAPGVELPAPRVSIPTIPVNELRTVRMQVRLPVTFDAAELPLTFEAVETRGVDVARTNKTQTWPVQLKRPSVEATYRLYDGNSTGSRGDRNGVANNGEKVELVLTPVNRGMLPARDVRISVVSRLADATVSSGSGTFTVGDLPPQAEGAELRTTLEISRTSGRDARIDDLPLIVTTTQRDFPAHEQAINLPFGARRPELVADVTATTLVEGAPGVLSLDVSNHGGLTAEEVQVEISSDNGALELLDGDGVPRQKLNFNIGTIGAEASASTIQIKAHVRRNLPSGKGLLKVVAAQRGFPSTERQVNAAIRKEEAAVVVSAPPNRPVEQPVSAHPAIAANIFFRDYTTGQQVALESIRLRFELQSVSRPDSVRLEHNHTDVPLPAPEKTSKNGVHVWNYAVPARLEYGENDFTVIAVTAEGVPSELVLSVNRQQDGKMWVAVVGVSKYSDSSIPSLKFAREDAVAVLDYYRNRFGLPEEQLLGLLDEKATAQNIRRTLGTELVRKASNPGDTVILYFAGHGKTEQDSSSPDSDHLGKYLLPYDTVASDLYTSALNMEEVRRILQRLAAERVVFIIDSCFSGAAAGGRSPFDPLSGKRSALDDTFLSKLADAGTGRVILTAARGYEQAEESLSRRHGVFTYFLLQGLQGSAADDDANGLIDVDEIFRFVSKRLDETTTSQHPVKYLASPQSGNVVLGSVNQVNH